MRPGKSKGYNKYRSVGNSPLHQSENSTFGNGPCEPIITGEIKESNTQRIKLLRSAGSDSDTTATGVSKELQALIEKAQHRVFLVHGDDDREPILETLYPYNTLCSLTITAFDGRTMNATGFFISRRCVITAGHIVFERKNWIRKARVVPGAVGDLEPYGAAIATKFRSIEGWTNNRDSNFDYGAIILDDDTLFNKLKSTIGFKTYSDEKTVEIVGYPNDKDKHPWKADGDILKHTVYKLFYEIDTEEGNSGSPILANINGSKYVIGLHTEGAYPNKGIYLRQGILDRWTEWINL